MDTQHSIDDWSRHMERLNTETPLANKETVNREEKQGHTHTHRKKEKRNERTQRGC